MQVYHEILDAEEIHDVVKEGGPETARAVVRSSLPELRDALIEIQVLEPGPIIVIHFADSRAVRQRARFTERLLVLPDVEYPLPFRVAVCRVDELGRDPAEIAVQGEVQTFQRIDAEVSVVDRESVWMGVSHPEPATGDGSARDDVAYKCATCHGVKHMEFLQKA